MMQLRAEYIKILINSLNNLKWYLYSNEFDQNFFPCKSSTPHSESPEPKISSTTNLFKIDGLSKSLKSFNKLNFPYFFLPNHFDGINYSFIQ